MPKVSVIIPVYNVEKYLRECLTSLLAQTLDDVELLCIDDGSKDGSLDILNEFSSKHSNIVVLTQENMGVGNTRNKGIKLAKGEYVCFFDPDDVYPDNDVLEMLYNNAKNNNVLVCGGEFSDFEDGQTGFNQKFYDSLDGYLFDKDGIIKYEDYQFDYGFHRFLYKREFLLSNELFFPPYKRFQDPPFFVKTLYKAKEFYAVHKKVYGYRYGHNVVKWSEEKVEDLLLAILDNFEFAKNNNLSRLGDYTFIRFKEHYTSIEPYISKKSKKIINQCSKIDKRVKDYIRKYNTKKFLENIFSIKNIKVNDTKVGKIITILGIKFRFQQGVN